MTREHCHPGNVRLATSGCWREPGIHARQSSDSPRSYVLVIAILAMFAWQPLVAGASRASMPGSRAIRHSAGMFSMEFLETVPDEQFRVDDEVSHYFFIRRPASGSKFSTC